MTREIQMHIRKGEKERAHSGSGTGVRKTAWRRRHLGD